MTWELKDIQEYADHLKRQHSSRDDMVEKMDKLYLMEWDDESRVKRAMENVKITMSPDARNKVIGAARLLTSTDPTFSLPREDNAEAIEAVADKIERWALDLWTRAGRVRKNPLHYDIVLSLLLYGEVCVGLTKTADMVAHGKGVSKAYAAQAQAVASVTPFIMDVYHPLTYYPDLTNLGLSGIYREVKMSNREVINEYGDVAAKIIGQAKTSYHTTSTICTWSDYEQNCTWIKGSSTPLTQEANDLGFIPYVVYIGEGSSMFEDIEDQRQPFLYAVQKSGMWERQNLALTVMYSMLFAIGSNPLFVETLNPDGLGVTMQFDRPGGKITVPYGGGFAPLLSKGIIDPSMPQALELAERKTTESTLYDQTLGEPLGANAPFSMVALLSQAGRLPLLVPQRKGSLAISDIVSMALRWFKHDGSLGYVYMGAIGELSVNEIPDQFTLDAKLDVDLPQDKLQSSRIATMLSGGEDPLLSKSWVREKVLSINQPDAMQEQIWMEQMANLAARKYFVDQMMQIQQKEQMAMQPQQQQQPPMGPPGVQPGGMQPPMGPPGVQPGGMQPPMGPPGVQGSPAIYEQGGIPPEDVIYEE